MKPMSSYAKEREEFIARMTAAFGLDKLHDVMLLLRHAKTHGNPPGPLHSATARERQERLEKRIKAICEKIGCRVETDGDPRGYTVKVFLPTGEYNTWGGAESGWGVPQ